MPEYGCIDLTLDSDEEREKARSDTEKKRQRPATPDSDIILVDDDEQQQDQQQKRAKGEVQQQQEHNGADDDDVVVESATGPVAIRDFAHGRPQCGNHAFKQGTSKDNSKCCDQCYCFVCDVKAEECQYWGEGGRARDHCNAHACHYWKSLRRQARKGSSSTALLQAEFNNSSSTLSTNWTLPVGGSSSSGGAGMKRGRLSMPAAGSMPSLATMWARKTAEKTPAPAAAAAAAATPASAAAAARTNPSLAAAAAAAACTPASAAAAAAAAGAPAATPAGAAAAAAAAGGSMSTPATAPGRLGVPATAIKQDPGAQKLPQQQQQQKQQQAAPKHFPAASSWLQRIPHPKDLKVPTQLLVTLELPFKTVKGVTVDDVASRLVPCGFYRDHTKPVAEFGPHLWLENITKTTHAYMPDSDPVTLQLLPIRPVDEVPVEPDTARPIKLTVISTTPGVKPVVVGVVVERGSKVKKLKAAVEAALAGHGFDSSTEGLVLAREGSRVNAAGNTTGYGDYFWLSNPKQKLGDEAAVMDPDKSRWLAVRVPVSMAKEFYKNGPMGEALTSRKLLLLHHETVEMVQPEERPGPTPGSDPYGDDDEDEDSYGRPLRRGYPFDDYDDDSDDYGCGYGCDSEDDYDLFGLSRSIFRAVDRYGGGITSAARPKPRPWPRNTEPLDVPMAVLLPGDVDIKGGEAEDKAVKELVIKHLVEYKTAGGPVPSSSLDAWKIQLSRMTGDLQRTLSSYHEDPMFSSRSIHNPGSYRTGGKVGVFQLWVQWTSPPSEGPAGFDAPAFLARPQLNDPDFEQQLKDLPALLTAAAEHASKLRVLKALPYEAFQELENLSVASAPPPNLQALVAFKPSAATVLSIIKAPGSSSSSSSDGHAAAAAAAAGSSKEAKKAAKKAAAAGGVAAVAAAGSSAAAAIAAAAARCAAKGKSADLQRLGVLKVDVYVFKQNDRLYNKLLETDSSDWGAVPRNPGRWAQNAMVACPLASTLNARLLQESGGFMLLQEVADLGRKQPAHGVAKLMEWLASGERPAAVQPPGLTVKLHPYQLQSLAFMQEAESWEGGWRHLLWRWLPPAPSQQQQQQQQQLAGPSSAAAAAAGGEGKAGVGPGVWWSPVLGRVCNAVPEAPWGGFLAEEMGLGKTIEVLGLILSNPAPPSVIAGAYDHESHTVVSRGTLVVCAVSLVGQWCTEAAKKLGGSLKMYPYHGSNRIRDKKQLATEFDIVVTTYATLGSDFGGKKNAGKTPSPLNGIKWHRIVFDEGHTVKNMTAAHSKACAALVSDRRWICTGTPINNDICNLLGQFSVLHMEPFATKSFFDAYVKHTFASYGSGSKSVPLLYTLRHTMIRHVKAQTIQGQSVLALPDKNEQLVPVVLSGAEREAYMRAHTEAADVWAGVRRMPLSTINQKLIQIQSLLGPLRRICSGGRLYPSDLRVPSDLLTVAPPHGTPAAAAAGAAAAAAAAAAGSGGIQEDCNITVPDLDCPICLDAYDRPVMTACHHWFCKECILGVLTVNPHCPLCRGDVNPADLRAPGKRQPEQAPPKKKRRVSGSSDGNDSDSSAESDADYEEGGGAAAGAAAAAGGGGGDDAGSSVLTTRRGTRFGAGAQQGEAVVCESKLQALLRELAAMREADPTSKALVFSQYTNTLDWLKQRLPEEGFGYRTITGSMPLKQRSKAIEAFQGDPPTTVFLLSIRSGAVGINLTAANHVFLLEPCLNAALEEQAIGRAWRMGQGRRVVVKRFYVKGSVEERIMDVRSIRQGHTSHAPGAGSGAGGATSSSAADDDDDTPRGGMGRRGLGAAELAGNLKADRQVLKIAELDILFRTPQLDTAAVFGAAPGTSAADGGGAGAAAGAAAGSSGAAAGSSGGAAAAAAGGSDSVAAAAGGIGAAAAGAAAGGDSGGADAAGSSRPEAPAAAGAAGPAAGPAEAPAGAAAGSPIQQQAPGEAAAAAAGGGTAAAAGGGSAAVSAAAAAAAAGGGTAAASAAASSAGAAAAHAVPVGPGGAAAATLRARIAAAKAAARSRCGTLHDASAANLHAGRENAGTPAAAAAAAGGAQEAGAAAADAEAEATAWDEAVAATATEWGAAAAAAAERENAAAWDEAVAATAAEWGDPSAAAAGGYEGGDAFTGMPASQEVRAIAQEANLQNSQQEMTPYLLAQLEQQRLALQFMERWEQKQKQKQHQKQQQEQ